MTTGKNRGELPRLDPATVAVFEHALSLGSVRRRHPDVPPGLGLDPEEVERACRALLALRLLR